jgi:hypothetical protein
VLPLAALTVKLALPEVKTCDISIKNCLLCTKVPGKSCKLQRLAGVGGGAMLYSVGKMFRFQSLFCEQGDFDEAHTL